MSVAPVEEMRRILLARTTVPAQESGAQIALALMETPVQMCSEYKAKQQYLASQQQQQQQSEQYRGSPRREFAGPALASTPELPPANLFNSTSPMQSPGNLGVPASPYFSGGTQHSRSMSQFGPNRSPGLRPQVMAEQRSQSFTDCVWRRYRVRGSCPTMDMKGPFAETLSPGTLILRARRVYQRGKGKEKMSSNGENTLLRFGLCCLCIAGGA
jgi:hypothetical protein